MINLFEYLSDKEKKQITEETLQYRMQENQIVMLNGQDRNVLIGNGLRLKYNASIGISNEFGYAIEIEKLEKISVMSNRPDTMMDLSIVKTHIPLYRKMIKTFGGPVGTLPHYTLFDKSSGIDKNELLEEIEMQAEAGVGFMTMHFTPTLPLFEKSSEMRRIPIISRGGSLVLRDMIINKREDNIFICCFNEIAKILKKYHVVVSIGSAFRPSCQEDAFDEIQLEEYQLQKKFVNIFKSYRIPVMMEGIGHASLSQIEKYVGLIRKDFYVPFMPLGPIATDTAIGFDHISSAIGASFMAYFNGADIINSVTKEEHTGGIPSAESIIEGIESAKIVVNIINDVRFPNQNNNQKKSEIFNCMGIKSENIGCSRCAGECPFELINQYGSQA